MFIVADGTDEDIADAHPRRPSRRLRRTARGNPGFGPAANTVAQFVEGDNGFFCFCHDDVALDPDAIRVMVEELYRSNAGIVGPKLVTWDNPRILQDVGLDVDRFGQPASRVEVGEVDQEQHDAVTDVFAVPSACFLVRADLFRALGGFDAAMSFHGEDVDLCWRAHIGGARVMVAPGGARASSRGARQPGGQTSTTSLLGARHHLRSTLTLTAGSRLPVPPARACRRHPRRSSSPACSAGMRERRGPRCAPCSAPSRGSRRCSPGVARSPSCGGSATPRCTTCSRTGSNRLASFRRAHDTQLVIGIEDKGAARWRSHGRRPALARAFAGADGHLAGGHRRRARRQPLVHQPLGTDDR